MFSLLFPLLITFILLYPRVVDHRITIRRVRIGFFSFSVFEIAYARVSTEAHFACSKAILCLHLPRSSAPYWGTFTACDLEYIDSDCHISSSKLFAKFWLFPLYFRFTAGPWLSIQLDNFRIRIFSSSDTPYYVKAMRKNLIAAMSMGEVVRLDDFHLECKTGSLSKATLSNPDSDMHTKPANHDEEEVRVTVSGTQCHILTSERRYYTFPDVVAQLRRNWVRGDGTFVMIAKDSMWSRVHSPYQRYVFSTFSRLLFSMVQFPLDLVILYQHPMTLVNLYVTRADITFDEFRIRDAELVIQGLRILEESLAVHGESVFNDLGNSVWDVIFGRTG